MRISFPREENQIEISQCCTCRTCGRVALLIASAIAVVFVPALWPTVPIVGFIIGVVNAVTGCPLTIYECRLRRETDNAPYDGRCISHYMQKWFGLKVGTFAFAVFIAVMYGCAAIRWLLWPS